MAFGWIVPLADRLKVDVRHVTLHFVKMGIIMIHIIANLLMMATQYRTATVVGHVTGTG
jgi:hypothetical protein